MFNGNGKLSKICLIIVIVFLLFGFSVLPVVAEEDDNSVPTVFVYQKTSYTGDWTDGKHTITFKNGYLSGDDIVEGLYTQGESQIMVTYPCAKIDVTLDGQSIIGKTIHPADAQYLEYSVTTENGYYTKGGTYMGLSFSNEEQKINDQTYFGVKNLGSASWNRSYGSTYDSRYYPKSGEWTIRSYFDCRNTQGALVSNTPSKYRYSQNSVSFNVSEAVASTHFPQFFISEVPKGGISLNTTESLYLNARCYDKDGISKSTSVLWTSSDPSILSVNAYGYLTPKRVGEVEITAQSNTDSSLKATTTIRVEETVVCLIDGYYSSSSKNVQIGTSPYAYVDVYDQFGRRVSAAEVIWEIDEGQANISLTKPELWSSRSTVTITPVSPGSATFFAYPASNTSLIWKQKLTVIEATELNKDIHYISLSDRASALYLGAEPESDVVYAYVYNADNQRLYDEEVEWASLNESIVSVTENYDVNRQSHYATLTPKEVGTTTILVSAKNNTLVNTSLNVTVHESVISSVRYPVATALSVSASDEDYIQSYDQYKRVVSNDKIILSVNQTGILKLSSGDQSSTSKIIVDSKDYVSITGLSPGTVILRGESESNSSAFFEKTIIVEAAEIASLSYYWLSSPIKKNQKDSLGVNAYDSQGCKISSNQNVVWTSSNPDVVGFTVNETKIGAYLYVIGLSEGDSTIRASLKSNPNIFVESTITVYPESAGSYIQMNNFPKDITMKSVLSPQPYAVMIDQYGSLIHGENITWTVDNSSVLCISPNITTTWDKISLVPVSPGTALIRAAVDSDRTRYNEHIINVLETIPSSLSISGTTELTRESGKVGSATAIVKDQLGYQIPEKVVWSVDDTSILSLNSITNSSVRYTPLSVGTTVLRAAVESNPEICWEHSVTVEDPIVTSVSIGTHIDWDATDSYRLLLLGETEEVWACVYDQFDTLLNNKKIIWSVDDPSILNLSKNTSYSRDDLVVTPLATGIAVITATSDNVSKTLEVHVESPTIQTMRLYCDKKQLTVGNTVDAYVYVYDQSSSTYRGGDTVYWSVDNSSVLNLSVTETKIDSGSDWSNHLKITAVAPGVATLTAYPASNPELKKTVTIIVETPELSYLKLSQSSPVTYFLNKSSVVTAYVKDQFDFDIPEELVIWSSSDQSVLPIAENTTTVSGKSLEFIPAEIGSAQLIVNSVTNPDLQQALTVNVEEEIASRLQLSSTSLKITRSAETQFRVFVYNQNQKDMVGETVLWSVDNSSIVELSANSSVTTNWGFADVQIKPLRCGLANLTVYPLSNPSLIKTIPITLNFPYFANISVPSSISLSTGNYEYINVNKCNQYGNTIYEDVQTTFKFTVDNQSVVSLSVYNITTSGSSVYTKLLALAPGQANITVYPVGHEEYIKTIPVIVEEPIPTSLYVSPSGPLQVLTDVGSMRAYVKDQFGDPIVNEKVRWELDNTSLFDVYPSITSYGGMYEPYVTLSAYAPKSTVNLTITSVSDSNLTTTIMICAEEPVAKTIYVYPASISTQVGEIRAISVSIYNQGLIQYFFGETVYWSVDNSSVLLLSGDTTTTTTRGKTSISVVAKSPGLANLTVYPESNPELAKVIPVTVSSESGLTSLYIDPGYSVSLPVGSTKNYHVYAYDENYDRLYGEMIQWYVDNSSVASLDKNKTITSSSSNSVYLSAHTPGIATLTAVSESKPDISTSVQIHVVVANSESENMPASLYLYPSDIVTTTGTDNTLSSRIMDSNSDIINGNLTWEIDNSAIAELQYPKTSGTYHYNYLTPTSSGEAVITVSVTNKPELNRSISLSVTQPIVSDMRINPYSSYGMDADGISCLLTVEKPFVISHYLLNQYSQYLGSDEKIKVSVDNPSILDLECDTSASGKTTCIIPKKEGRATITLESASNPAVKVSFRVNVVENNISTVSVSSPSGTTVGANSIISQSATVLNAGGSVISETPVVWSVDDSSIVDIINSVTLSGLNYHGSAYLLPKTSGTVRLTATSADDSSKSASSLLVVKESIPARIEGTLTGSGSVSMDAISYLQICVYDQYNNIIPNPNLVVSFSEPDIIRLGSVSEDDFPLSKLPNTYVLIPVAVGTSNVIVKVNGTDAPIFEKSIEVVADTIPTLRTSYANKTNLTIGNTKNIVIEAHDQFGNPLRSNAYSIEIADPSVLSYEHATDEFNLYSSDLWNDYLRKDPGYYYDRSSLNFGSQRLKLSPKKIGNTTIRLMSSDGQTASDNLTVQVMEKADIRSINIYGIDENPILAASDYQLNEPVGSDFILPLGTTREGLVLMYDTFGNWVCSDDDVDVSVDNPEIVSIQHATPISGYYGMKDVYGLLLTGLKEGTATIHAVSKSNPVVNSSMNVYVVNITLTPDGSDKPESVSTQVMPPDILPGAGTFTESRIITMSTGTAGASIYYTLDGTVPTSASTHYTGEFMITETTQIKAIAIKEGVKSTVVSSLYTKEDPVKKYSISIVPVNGGSVSTDVTSAVADTMLTLSITEDVGWQFSGWKIKGLVSEKTAEKKASVKEFAMWSEDIEIIPEFIEAVADPIPYSVKITNVPTRFYENDTGTLNAIVYDQFGERYAYNAVSWVSDNSSVFGIESESGVYTANSGGTAIVTATVQNHPEISTTLQISVFVPPKPLITGEISGPVSAYYGVMSDPYLVTSNYTTYLNWNWGDGSSTKSVTKEYARYLGLPVEDRPNWVQNSVDSVAHTFIEIGDVKVTLTPSNTYRFGDSKTFHVNVSYAPPRNIKITDGPSTVISGSTVSYTAFATGADRFTWYLDDTLVAGQTGAIALIPIPSISSAKSSVIKVVASKKGVEAAPVTKQIEVSVAGGDLGDLGALSLSPALPTKNEVTVFTIPAVTNAIKYIWSFTDGSVIETTAPSVAYSLKDTITKSVTVTALNSASVSISKEYSFPSAGTKPGSLLLTPDKTTAYPGDTVTYICNADSADSWVWSVDGVVADVDSDTHSVSWTVDDIGRHLVSVTASNLYGSTTKSIGYDVLPKPGKPAEIESILGPSRMVEGSSATFSAVIRSNDEYSLAWYLDGKLQDETDSVLQLTLAVGYHNLRLYVVTEYDEVTEMEKSVYVEASESINKAKSDAKKADADDGQNLRLVDESITAVTALSNVGSVSVDSSDISSDADSVAVAVSPVDVIDIYGFTSDMGDKNDALLCINITPSGLKNEKNLDKCAEITINVAKNKVANPDAIEFYRLDTGSGIDRWVKLTKEGYVTDGDFYIYTIKTSGMSTFVATEVGVLSAPTSDIPIEEIVNSTLSWNSEIPLKVGYHASPSALLDITAPKLIMEYGDSAVSLLLDDTVDIQKVGGVLSPVTARVLDDGSVLLLSGTVDDADAIDVIFIGRVLGDSDGDGQVTVNDAVRVAQSLVNIIELDEKGEFYGDTDGDGQITVNDAVKVAQRLVNLVDENYEKI